MYEDLLRQAPLFQDISRRELTWLGEACRERDYAAGDALIRTGTANRVGPFMVTLGSVCIVRQEATTTEVERGIVPFGAGTALGDLALLEEAPSMVTITAAEPTHAVMLSIWDFRETLRDYPDLAIHLLAILSQRLRAQLDETGEQQRRERRSSSTD
jgi:CRP-like cAMP-binding protein